LAIEVVKLLVKLLMKLYQTGLLAKPPSQSLDLFEPSWLEIAASKSRASEKE
jgi:hypothetical protein